MEKKICVLIAVGGTGGHLLPAQQLKDLLREDSRFSKVVFAGHGIKKNPFFQKKEESFYEVKSRSIRKKNPFSLFLSLFQIAQGVFQSFSILRKEKPDIVISMGSYHSFPVVYAAEKKKIPILVFEANRVLGKVNRFFVKKGAAVAAQFPLLDPSIKTILVPFLPWKKELTSLEEGKEDREEEKSGDKEKLADSEKRDKKTLLIFGGSQGAKFLNELLFSAVDELKRSFPFLKIIHATGDEKWKALLEKKYKSLQIESFVTPYHREIEKAYRQADFVIARSGASTLGELIKFSKPALLIPYPFSTENHQKWNAQFMEKTVKGALTYEQKQMNPKVFIKALKKVFEGDFLEEKKRAISTFREKEKRVCFPDVIAQNILAHMSSCKKKV